MRLAQAPTHANPRAPPTIAAVIHLQFHHELGHLNEDFEVKVFGHARKPGRKKFQTFELPRSQQTGNWYGVFWRYNPGTNNKEAICSMYKATSDRELQEYCTEDSVVGR